jgi:signal transduction histidine kinase
MKRRLILLAVATSSLVLVAFMIPLALLLRTVASERAVDSATAQIQSLSPLVAALDSRSLALAADGQGRSVTVFLPDGEVVGDPVPRDPAVVLASRGRSLTAAVPGGREVVVAVAGLPSGTAVIRTFVSDGEMSRGVARAWLVLGVVGVGLLAVSVSVAALLARSLVRPLTALVGTSDTLAEGDLTVRSAGDGPPEVRQVGASLDRLAGRIEQLLQRERETVADLSHRLRTPLTALRIDGESLRDPEEASRIARGLDNLERAVSDVIRTARGQGGDVQNARSDAARVVRERVEFWSALAEDQERPMAVDLPSGPVPVGVSSDDLAVCVDTLLDNVFAHTDEGVPFALQLTAMRGGGGCLIVSDAGPGFTDPDQASRGRASEHGRSTGLGLDIARRTAEMSGGALTLTRSPAGGGAVVVELGPPLGAPRASDDAGDRRPVRTRSRR